MADRPTSSSQHPAAAGSTGQAGPDRVRCVLWHAPGAAMPGDLLSTLSKRIAHFTFCTDGFAALANVCAIERERREAKNRGGAGAGGHAASLLVIIEPDELAEFGQIIGAVGVYAPGATLRQWRRGANPRFAPVVDAGMVTPTSPVVVPRPIAPPSLRLAGGDDAAGKPVASRTPAARPWGGNPQLSEEELRMLLEDEPPAAGGARP